MGIEYFLHNEVTNFFIFFYKSLPDCAYIN